MSVRRRGRSDIVVDILEATSSPTNKMRVMYRSNLNFMRFNRYLSHLLRKGLVEEMNGSGGRLVYKTTERGRKLLKVLKEAQVILYSDES